MITLTFIYLFVLRIVSGAQNGAGYAKHGDARKLWTWVFSALLGAGLIGVTFWHASTLFGIITTLQLVGGLVGIWGVDYSFSNRKKGDIHFFETIATGTVTMAALTAGLPLIPIVTHVPFAMLGHKGLINLGSGLPFWSDFVEEENDKDYTIKWLVRWTKGTFLAKIPIINGIVPRFSWKVRAVLAIVGIGLTILSIIKDWDFSIFDIIPKLVS